MNSRALLALLLIGLLAGVGYVVLGTDPAPVDPGTGSGVGEPDNGGGKDQTGERPAATGGPGKGNRKLLDNSESAASGEPAAYRKALNGLRGRLIWARSRKPLQGVEVKVIEAWLDAVVPSLEDFVGVETMRSPVVFRSSATTDKDGVFELSGVHGRAVMILAIGLKTEVATVRPVPRAPRPGELVDMGDIEIQERGIVTGRIVDDAGAGVAAARVRIADLPREVFQFGVEHFHPEGKALIAQGPYQVVLSLPPWLKDYDEFLPFGDGRTDQDGYFRIAGVRPGSPTVIVSKDQFAPTTRSIQVRAEIEQDVGSITMGEGEFLSGSFVDTDGKPVAGVRVTAGAVLPIVPVGLLKKPLTVGADGKFEISGLPRGKLYLCYQRKPGKPWEVSGPYAGEDAVKIELGALRTGTVRLVAKNGQPIDHAKFDVFRADVSSYLPGFETHIPGDDHFSRDREDPNLWHVRGLTSGPYKVIVKAPGFAFGTGVVDLSKQSAEERTETIELYPAPVSRFEVKDTAGDPVEAARIYWNASPGRAMERTRWRRLTRLPILLGKTDADGLLTVDSLEVGARRFYCRHPGFAMAKTEAAVAQGQVIRFVLGPTGRLVGEVAENGRPPKGSRTVLAEPTGKLRRAFAGVLMPRMTTTMPDGSFSFGAIQPGKWRVRAIKDLAGLKGPMDFVRLRRQARSGSMSSPVGVEVRATEESFVYLESGANQAPQAGGILSGSVRINGKAARGVWVQTWAGRQRAEVQENGVFELTGLADGDLWIGVERSGDAGFLPNRLWEGRVQIVNSNRVFLHIDVQVTDVSVEVVDQNGRPAPELPIELLGVAQKTGGYRGRVRLTVATDGSGTAVFHDVPAGVFKIRSMMQRDPVLVVPVVDLTVYAGRPVKRRLTATAPAVVSGSVEWDESQLKDELERKYARANRPTYLVFESDGRYTWGPVRTTEGRSRFELRKAAPGAYRLQPRGKLRWHAAITIAPGGTSSATLRMTPDLAQLRAAVDKLRPKSKPKQTKGGPVKK